MEMPLKDFNKAEDKSASGAADLKKQRPILLKLKRSIKNIMTRHYKLNDSCKLLMPGKYMLWQANYENGKLLTGYSWHFKWIGHFYGEHLNQWPVVNKTPDQWLPAMELYDFTSNFCIQITTGFNHDTALGFITISDTVCSNQF